MLEREYKPVGYCHEIVIDCAEPRALAEFWRGMLGGEIDATNNWVALVGGGGIGKLAFQRVPEGKSVKNRMHIDVEVTDLAEATVRAVALGATAQGDVFHEPPGSFQVLLDPEGNEFCLVSGYPRSW
ncbi:VOC family protein [Candidatus Kaiserbacteria bacterium]|nr:VOC family protein [Candidatus Kaiserbacteria bacterium]